MLLLLLPSSLLASVVVGSITLTLVATSSKISLYYYTSSTTAESVIEANSAAVVTSTIAKVRNTDGSNDEGSSRSSITTRATVVTHKEEDEGAIPKTGSSTRAVPIHHLPAEAREKRYLEVTMPFANETTMAWTQNKFFAGYRNQIMAFKAIVLHAVRNGYRQMLAESLKMKDMGGTNRAIDLKNVIDLEHWNSYFPRLPRIVHCEQDLMPDYDCETQKMRPGYDNATKPLAFTAKQHHLFAQYMRYQKGKKTALSEVFRDPADLLIIQGALRIHPELAEHADRLLQRVTSSGNETDKMEYMALHARIEPDMQAHPVCRDRKVLHLAQIVKDIETYWKDPPVRYVFMPINRQNLEKEGQVNEKNPNATNWIAVENLQELNRIRDEGLWNGRAKVFELGINSLEGTRFAARAATSGAMLDFYVAEQARIFVGTEVSSWSMDLLGERFYKGNIESYKILPDGIHRWTNETTEHPEAFSC